MKLIIITQPHFFNEEAQWINTLMQAGLQYLHLRKPTATAAQLSGLIEQIDGAFYGRIILHDHFELAAEYGLLGIHLNGRHPYAPSNFTGHISRSCHSLEEVAQYKDACHYVTLSPIYSSISKQGYPSAFSTEQLIEAALQGIIDDQVIALGGVTLQHIAKLHRIGFGGVAVLGTIWNEPTLAEAVERCKALCAATDECSR